MNETQYLQAKQNAIDVTIPTRMEIQKLSPSAIIDMLILDVSPITSNSNDIFYFHNGLNSATKGIDNIGSIQWKGVVYANFPYELTGIEYSSSGVLPRPRLKIGQINNLIGAYVYQYNNLLGSKVTRVRTLAKFLDSANYPGSRIVFATAPTAGAVVSIVDGNNTNTTIATANGIITTFHTTVSDIISVYKNGVIVNSGVSILSGSNPLEDTSQEFPYEVYYIDRKVSNTPTYIEFELASILDLEGVMIPRRQCVQNTCQWVYKSAECGYSGTAYFDSSDRVTTGAQDVCGKRLRSCEVRFGEGAYLPYGGFPGVGRVGYA